MFRLPTPRSLAPTSTRTPCAKEAQHVPRVHRRAARAARQRPGGTRPRMPAPPGPHGRRRRSRRRRARHRPELAGVARAHDRRRPRRSGPQLRRAGDRDRGAGSRRCARGLPPDDDPVRPRGPRGGHRGPGPPVPGRRGVGRPHRDPRPARGWPVGPGCGHGHRRARRRRMAAARPQAARARRPRGGRGRGGRPARLGLARAVRRPVGRAHLQAHDQPRHHAQPGERGAERRLGAEARVLGEQDADAGKALARALGEATVAIALDALGACDALFDVSLDVARRSAVPARPPSTTSPTCWWRSRPRGPRPTRPSARWPRATPRPPTPPPSPRRPSAGASAS